VPPTYMGATPTSKQTSRSTTKAISQTGANNHGIKYPLSTAPPARTREVGYLSAEAPYAPRRPHAHGHANATVPVAEDDAASKAMATLSPDL
jgi:hypothetical protein